MEHLPEDVVKEVIELAKAAFPVTGSGRIISGKDLKYEDFIDSPEETALREKLDTLNPCELAELMALMWLGRQAGGETADDYPNLVELAHAQIDGGTVSYIAAKAPLARYLTDGLLMLPRKVDFGRFFENKFKKASVNRLEDKLSAVFTEVAGKKTTVNIQKLDFKTFGVEIVMTVEEEVKFPAD